MFTRETIKTKTFWAGLLSALGGIGAGLSGSLDWGSAAAVVVQGVLAMTVRDAITKAGG